MREWNEMEQIGAPRPIPLAIRQEVFSPYHYLIKEPDKMNKVHLQPAEIKVEFIPALL
jgi:AraC family transcriptional regulator